MRKGCLDTCTVLGGEERERGVRRGGREERREGGEVGESRVSEGKGGTERDIDRD